MRPISRYAMLAAAAVLGSGATTTLVPAPAYAASWTISATSRCESDSHLFAVTWNISNYESAQLNLTGARSSATPPGTSTLSYVTASGEAPLPITLPITGGKGAALGAATPSYAKIIQRIPGISTQADVSFIGSFVGSTTSFTINGSQPLTADCIAPSDSQAQPPVQGPSTAASSSRGGTATPDAEFASECDGTVTVTLTNRRTSGSALTFNVQSGDGVFTHATDVARQQTAKVTVPAEHAAGVRARTTGLERGPYSWSRPATCASPSASGSPTAGDTGQGRTDTDADGRGNLDASGHHRAGPHRSLRVPVGIGLLVIAALAAILAVLLVRQYRRAPKPPGRRRREPDRAERRRREPDHAGQRRRGPEPGGHSGALPVVHAPVAEPVDR